MFGYSESIEEVLAKTLNMFIVYNKLFKNV